MKYTKLGAITICALSILASGSAAYAFCTPSRADVSILCPQPVPYPGPKHLTPTSRNMPTVGTPGLYKNWGNGKDVRVYLGHHGTGYQEFQWAVPNDYGKQGY